MYSTYMMCVSEIKFMYKDMNPRHMLTLYLGCEYT